MIIVIGIVFIIIGLIICVVGVRKQKKCTEVTEGKIVDIAREVRSGDSNKSYTGGIQIGRVSIGSEPREIYLYPIYEYKVNGNTYVEKSTTNSNGAVIGQTVEIHYNPNNPRDFYSGKSGIIIQIVLGIIFSIIGIVVIFTAL